MRALLLAACTLVLVACSSEADFSDQIAVETLNAEEYQQEIASIDRLLFTEAPLGDENVRALESAMSHLASRVASRNDSKFLRVESLELRLLAKRAGRLSPSGTGAALQGDWMRIRNNLFDDRAWFARSAADLEYAAQVFAAPAKEDAAAVVPEEPEPSVVIDSPRRELTGRWRVTSMLGNGTPNYDPEMAGSIWSFEPPRLVIGKGDAQETYSFTPAGEFLFLTNPKGKVGWMRYEIADDGLRIAFFDGLTEEKPESFEAEPGRKDPMLIVLRLVPAR
jgi:hypothetical protein